MRKAIILAAGKGTRMHSKLFKVLHEVAGLPMINHLLNTLDKVNVSEKVVIVGKGMDAVSERVAPCPTVVQDPPMGTGHAVSCAEEKIGTFDGSCLVLFGDTPLITEATMSRMIEEQEKGSDVVVLGFRPKDPLKYGRLIVKNGILERIVEFKDATPEERAITLCNAGAMCLSGKKMWSLISEIKNNNAAGEYYLTDVVKIARDKGLVVSAIETDEYEVAGVNSRKELSNLERIYQNRKRQYFMDKGVSLVDPDTVYFSYDTEIENDVVIEPCVCFGPKVRVFSGARVKAFSKIENTEVHK